MIKMVNVDELKKVLENIPDGWVKITDLINISDAREKSDRSIYNVLLNLEKIGFVIRETDEPLSKTRWKVTLQARAFLKLISSSNDERDKINSIVMTIPQTMRDKLLNNETKIFLTSDVFNRIFSESKRSIKILIPYVDASIIQYLDKISSGVKIEIITTKYVNQNVATKNPVLERLKSKYAIEVKYIHESKEDVQLYQIHAKILISDDNLIYIGSANFKETSILHNLETGILSSEKKLIGDYQKIYDELFNSFAK